VSTSSWAGQTFEKSGLRFSMKAVNASRAAGSLQHAAEALALVVHLLQHRLLLALLHQPLGLHQAGERLGGQLARLRLRVVVGLGGRQHAVDQAHFQRGFGHEGLAQQQRLGRAVVAEHLRHQQAGRRLGHRPRFTKGIENAALSPA
jgi:hypothetical protein